MDVFNQIETVIFYFFNETCKSLVLDYVMPLITEIGDGTFLFGVALIMLLAPKAYRKMSGILLMAGLTFVYNICNVLKLVVERPRPFLVLKDVSTVFTTGGFSFPSTHSAMVFMAAVILARCFRTKPVFYILATIVSLSRIYLGLHYPSDVLAGAVIGVFIGSVMVHFGESAGIYPKE